MISKLIRKRFVYIANFALPLLIFVVVSAYSPMLFSSSGTIQEIVFLGNKRVPNETISTKINSKAGDSLNRQIVRDDIKSLYKTGQFEDIKIESEPSSSGLKLCYIFVEKPVITEIGF
ncbi:MAG: hypothetical protein COS89_07295, partial [Deltaproteobacteria bacterium CG07_land_8_20_14_0_80_38_7]